MAIKFENALESGVENGIEWAIMRAPLYGAVNGYARLPAGHPWQRLDLQMGAVDVDVHGGITYGPDPDGWVGFDTLHSGDYWPGYPYGRDHADIEWDDAMVREEAIRLAGHVSKALEGAA